MLWYNTESHALQSKCPAGEYASENYMKINYPQWTKVADDFVVPVVKKEVSKEERLEKIDKKYKTLLDQYKDSLLSAELLGRDTAKIKEKYQAVFKEYIAAKKEVK